MTTTKPRMSVARTKAHDRMDRAFGAKDWDAYYRALDALMRVVHEEAGGDPADFVPLKDDAPPEKQAPVPRFPACGNCKGTGEANVVDHRTSAGEAVYRVGECPKCRGSGEDRSRGKVMPEPEKPEEERPPTPAYAVMQVTMENPPLGWTDVWGVIAREGNPMNGSDWMGLFPSRENAERFRGTL